MDDLFVVYHSFVKHRHQPGRQNPSPIALSTLDSSLEIAREMAPYAYRIHSTGGLQWSEVEQRTQSLMTGFETG